MVKSENLTTDTQGLQTEKYLIEQSLQKYIINSLSQHTGISSTCMHYIYPYAFVCVYKGEFYTHYDHYRGTYT